MSKLWKKILILTIIIAVFVIPFYQSFAEDNTTKFILIEADKYFVTPGEAVKITAEGRGITIGLGESRFSNSEQVPFYDFSCAYHHNNKCSAKFKPPTKGIYTVRFQSQKIDDKIYTSPFINITVIEEINETNNFKIFGNKHLVKSNEIVSITAIIFSKEKPPEFNFSSSPSVEGFNDTAKCKPTEDKNIGKENLWSCTVQFQSSTKKQVIYDVSAFVSNSSFTPNKSDIVQITVGEGVVSLDVKPEDTVVPPNDGFGCNVFNIGGCVAQLFYNLWQASAWVATIGGHFLDFFVYYSTNSDSYRNDFVEQGWGAVRDIANIFFIVALLYVAIKTILGLNVTDNKKLVGTVIIIALIINFSLFTTKVVIDGSNILAKIFYNNITSVDDKDKELEAGAGGQKSISIGLIEKFNPQQIAMDQYNSNKLGLGYFIFLTLLLMAVTLYTGYIFFSVAILFVARVISLWIAMIFSPLAFVSYAVPFEIPGFGHKEWWDELLKNAFLAPLFIFFLYLIIRFTKFMGEIIKYEDNSLDIIPRLLTMIIPFVLIIMLLKKAKDLAVKYSGAMGAALMKGAQIVGGVALGAATGGAAMLGRQTLGRVASNVAETETMKNWAAKSKFGAGVLKTTRGIGSGSFDARGIKVGGKSLVDTGLKNIGKAKEGGFTKGRKDYVEKQEKFASSLEMNEKERWEREQKEGVSYTYTGQESEEEKKAIKARIDKVNKDRTLLRAKTVEGRGIFNSNIIAATKIREAGHNKAKKLQDALIAATTGETSTISKTPKTGGKSSENKSTPEHK